MLEGLEITELRLSAVRAHNAKLRVDSGYFAKPMLAAERLVRGYAGGYDELGSLFSHFAKGVFDMSAESYSDRGVPFLRILNLRNGVIDDADLALIPEALHEAERKTELRRGDIVLSKTAYPAASLVTLDRCNTSQDTIATSLSDYGRTTYAPEVIVAFLNSDVGSQLLLRQFQGNVQLHLSLDDGRKVPMPRFGCALQHIVARAFACADRQSIESKGQMQAAEQLVRQGLGLDRVGELEPVAYTRTSRDAFDAGRLDAEHFKPKYVELLRSIEATGCCTQLGTVLVANQRGKQPEYAESEGGSPVVNSKHVADGTVRLDGANRCATAGDGALLIKRGDVVMNGTGVGTIGRAAPYLHDAPALPDNHVTVLRPAPDAIDPVYLAVYLNSRAGQMQVEQRSRGSSGQIELYPSDIAEFSIWLAPTEVQAEVRAAVEASFAARRRAAALLGAAKRAVEIAIEDSEPSALAWLADALRLP